jgi:hypothetical protein
MRCGHPRDRRVLQWQTDFHSKISWIVGARCGKCGASLNVSTPAGEHVSGPRRAGQSAPSVTGRPKLP